MLNEILPSILEAAEALLRDKRPLSAAEKDTMLYQASNFHYRIS